MRSLRNSWLLLAVTMLCSATSGCSGVSLGPQVKTEYVILHPGRPMVVLENVKLKGRVVDGSGDAVEQDVGGWLMMDPSHWEAVKRGLEK